MSLKAFLTDGERSFTAAQQTGQIVTSNAFYCFLPVSIISPLGRTAQTQHVIFGDTVFQSPWAASIFSDIASERTPL